MKKAGRRSGLFRKHFVITMSIILIAFIFSGAGLMLLVSGVWMNERMEMLTENTVSIQESTRDLLTSNYLESFGRNTVIMICNNLLQLSNATDSDYFIVNEWGRAVYCKDLIRSLGLIDSNGDCLVHGKYKIPEEIMEVLRKGETYKIGRAHV